jgi:C4-dicarboxylate-specific signal transduction histidine kinase
VLKKENELYMSKLFNEEKKLEKLISNLLDIKPSIHPNINKSLEETKSHNSDAPNKSLDLLNKKKEEQSKKLMIETQYTNSLLNMLTNEKINFQNSEESYHQIKDKLRKLKLSVKYIDGNISENSKRTKNVTEMNKGVKDELEKMNLAILSQLNKIGFLAFSIEKEKVDVTEKRKLLDEKNVDLERETKSKKDDLKSKIVEAEKMKVVKLNDENRVSRIVLGLYLIKM